MQSNWTQDFRLKIIALTLEPRFFSVYGEIIQPEFFENEAEMTLVTAINTYYGRYSHAPDLPDIEHYIQTLDKLKDAAKQETCELARLVFALDSDLSYARDSILEFAKMQALKIAMLDAIEKIEDGNVDGIDRQIGLALETGIKDDGFRLIRDVDHWLEHIATEEKVTTGLFHCDLMLDGGLSRGEIGVVIAPPNYGKSMTLANIGYGAAGVGYNVTHVTLELSPEKLAKRYGARTTFEWVNKSHGISGYKAKFLDAAGRRLRSDIEIIGYPPNTLSADMLRRRLDRLSRQGFDTDILLVDYADLMLLPRGNNSFEIHGENYSRLIQIAKDYNLALWTASQSHRASLRKLTVDMDDIAESFQKAARADVLLTYCQTPEEEDDHEMRFFCAKNRDGLKHWYVRCKVHDNAHALVSQDVVWGSDLVQEKSDAVKARRG